MKTCIWCANPCEKYFKEIAPACHEMIGQDADELRSRTAHECENYVARSTTPTPEYIEPKIKYFVGECKLNEYAQSNPPCITTVSGTAQCPECAKPMCPVCHRHNVTQLSRVTGYIGDIGGWNEGKKQEFKDRRRYEII